MPLEALLSLFRIAPPIFFGGALVFCIVLFAQKKIPQEKFKKRILHSIAWVFGFRIFYALASTVTQYFVWAGNPTTRVFLDQGIPEWSPIAKELSWFPFLFQKFGYFLFYSYGRFWLNVFIVFLCAGAFYLFLKALAKWKKRFFEDGEIELGALAVLIVGWPNFILFLLFVFLSVILISLFRLVFFKEAYTTLGAPFLLATIIIFLFGNSLAILTGLSVLRI
jgi:hypothetical protein